MSNTTDDRDRDGTEQSSNRMGDLRQLEQIAGFDATLDHDDVYGCESCMGAFIALSEPSRCPFCGESGDLR